MKLEKHNLFEGRFNFERYLSSPVVNALSNAGQGMYTRLLFTQFLSPSGILDGNQRVMRRLARPESDAEWDESWPLIRKQFVKCPPDIGPEGHVYNKVMYFAWEKSVKASTIAQANGKLGGRPKPHKEPAGIPTRIPSGVPPGKPIHQSINPSNHQATKPESTAQILAGSTSEKSFSIITDLWVVLEKVTDSKEWTPLVPWLQWACQYQEFDSVLKYVQDCMNPDTRRSKDLGVLKAPLRYFVSALTKNLEAAGIEVPHPKTCSQSVEHK